MKNLALLFLLLLALAFPPHVLAQTSEILLQTDFKGTVVAGSMGRLLQKVRAGKKLRIGWQLDFDKDGAANVEHWIDAEFITILDGHVFNQIGPIYRQIPKEEIPQVQIRNSNMQWTAIIGTNGKLLSRYIIPDLHLIEDEEVRAKLAPRTEVTERLVATTWVVID